MRVVNALTASTVKFDILDQADQTLASYTVSAKAGDQATSATTSACRSRSPPARCRATRRLDHRQPDPDRRQPCRHLQQRRPEPAPALREHAQVTAGSFTVNGISVSVLAGDSINSVVARINSTVGGVTASFANDRPDDRHQRHLRGRHRRGRQQVGFLAAVKLDGAITARGNIRDDQQVLAKTTQFASVAPARSAVNGVAIAVDRDTDTLASIIGSINAPPPASPRRSTRPRTGSC